MCLSDAEGASTRIARRLEKESPLECNTIGFHIDFAYCTDDPFDVIELIVHSSFEVDVNGRPGLRHPSGGQQQGSLQNEPIRVISACKSCDDSSRTSRFYSIAFRSNSSTLPAGASISASYTIFAPSTILSSIVQPGCDAVHGRGKSTVEFLVDVSTALPPQQFDLNQAERVHVGVTQLNGARQNGTALQEP